MPKLISAALLAVLAACASSPASEAVVVDARSALSAHDIEGRVIDLNADLERGLPVALVFWQAW
jgi:uncharacterized lipoprotein